MKEPLRSVDLRSATGDAPGRLDLLGGVADYSGSLVLQMPTQVRTSLTLTPENTGEARFASPTFGEAALELAPLRQLIGQEAAPGEFRAHLETSGFPDWARYPLGCFIMLARHGRWFPNSGFFLQIGSAVPYGQGVSSSAALEIATLRAFNCAASLDLSPLEIAHLGQQAENLIVGASCGLMDQLASSCGRTGELLPILCRPDTLYDSIPLPAGLVLAGWPSGVKHQVGASPYSTARAAAFMGKRILETRAGERWPFTSEIPLEIWRRFGATLPASLPGIEYLNAYAGTDDPLTTIDPGRSYPVHAATRFPIEENARAQRARDILPLYACDPKSHGAELRTLLQASHEGYGAMGLGSKETDAFVRQIVNEPLASGLIGGRISGGGSGGTVVVLFEEKAEKRLRSLALQHAQDTLIF